ncbi:MAG: alanine dehydrogenase [Gammaproteobacteria bacterium]
MNIGVPKEIKDREQRVGLTPAGAAALCERGHHVLVESGAGDGSGYTNDDYVHAGAKIVDQPGAWHADLVTKVKEPLDSEYGFLRGQIIFTYFHLAGVTPSLTHALLETQTSAVAYETVAGPDGRLPLLAPMSAVAGTMAVTMGAYYLAQVNGGSGTLLGRVRGRESGRVCVIGDGIVGRHAAAAALGIGARTTIASRHREREATLKRDLSDALSFVLSEPDALAEAIRDSDLVVGAVLSPGAKAPKVVSEAMVRQMRPGSVIVDVSIDQGGCIASARPTSHSSPTYVEHGVTHYCVTNMPGAYPRTSTIALTDATLPYTLRLADAGLDALKDDPDFAQGLNTHAGHITHVSVARDLDLMAYFQAFTPA